MSQSNSPITYEDVADVTIDLCSRKSRDVALALLKQYGVHAAFELMPWEWADFCSDARAILGDVAEVSKPAASEKQHPRLTWADSKPVDRFDGFIVNRFKVAQPQATSGKFSSPDLAGEWKPFEFGSAHLKVKAA